MNVTVQIKNSATSGNTPTTLANGELAINRADGRLFYKHANGTIVFLATGGGGGSSANAFGVVNIAGQANVVATTTSDIVRFRQGTGIVLTTDPANNLIDIAATGGSATDQFARDQANAAFSKANIATTNADAAFSNANTAIYTASQIRANLSNTTPINYDSTTGVISHANSGIAATTYGNTTHIPVVTVDAKGHVTAITNTAIALPSGQDQFARDQANAAFNQANTANIIAASAYAQANIATTNADAAFTRANAAYANANTAIYTATQIRANISNTTPIRYDSTTGVISHAVSGVTATGYGDSSHIPVFVVDDKGHIVSVSNVAIETGAGATDAWARDQANAAYTKANSVAQNAFVTINVAGQANVVADSNVDTLTLVAGSGIVITTDAPNDTITIASTGGSGTDQFARDQANAAFNQANTANIVAASAYNQANIATTNADAAFVQANVGTVLAQTARDHANGAFTQANTGTTLAQTARDHANGAFTQANVGTVLAQTARDHANGAFNQANTAVANTGVTTNGAVLIGNTVSGGFDLRPLTQGSGIAITNDRGTITIAATGGSALDQFARDTANGAYAHANGAFNQANTANTVAASAYAQANIATINADAAFTRANAAYANANTAIYTATQIRANISNTAPINYDPITGIISHATSGVTATTYGTTTSIPQITIDARGHITSASNVTVDQTLAQTARDHANAAFNQANTANTVAASAYTQANIATANADAAFVQANTAGTLAQTARDHANGAFNQANTANTVAASAYAQANIATTNADAAFARANAAYANANTAIYTATQIRANISNTAPINYDPTTGIVSHAASGVTATGYGDAATIPVFVVNTSGHVTSVTNTAIAIAASQVTSGTLAIARGGTGQTAIGLNGAILISNTVSGGYDINRITAGTGILVNNDKGSIEIVATGGSAIDQFARDTANGAYAHANGAFNQANTGATLAQTARDHANGAYTTANTQSKSISVFSPAVTDNITFFWTSKQLTVTRVISHVQGTTPNVTYALNYANTRATGILGTAITGDVVCANTTNGVFTTTFSDAVVLANNYVTLRFPTITSSADQFALTIEYTQG